MTPLYSLIVPVYNRPDELRELLESLVNQSFKAFEVIVVEDGSEVTAEAETIKFEELLNLKYFFKSNSGPGLSRNYGADRADADVLIFLDSDCVIPRDYLLHVDNFLRQHTADCFGGPDKFHPDFTPIQKAIGFAMSSFWTTGGIRGGKTSLEKFHPRSFNMGFTKAVYKKTGGFSPLRFGEDIDLSIRIKAAGFTSALIPEAFVYHKRRTDFKKFYKQVYNSGIARINLYKRHPKSLKAVHFFPFLFTLYFFFSILLCLIIQSYLPIIPLAIYAFVVFLSSLVENKSFLLSFLSVQAAFIQLSGYGLGFAKAVWKRIILKQAEFEAFKNNFYK